MSQFFNSIKDVKANYKIYDAWEQAQADERAQKTQLAKTTSISPKQSQQMKAKAESIIRATELMDKRSEDNAENVEQMTGIASSLAILPLSLLPTFFQKTIKNSKSAFRLQAASLVAMFAATIGLIFWSNSKQKQASRIGRFQAKQNELKDVKNFVVYTPEQIAKAEEIAKNVPDEKEKKEFMKMISDIKQINKDKPAYKKWLSERNENEIEMLKQMQFTPEQLKQGEEDKELIVDAVKEINIRAEEYSENAENMFDTMAIFSVPIGAAGGFVLNKILKTTKVCNDKISKAISILAPTLATIGIMIWGTAEQKKASRVGRFKARQELLETPERLMNFSKEQMASVKDVTAEKQKQGVFHKIGQNFKFLSTYFKDKKEHSKYKKTTQKHNEKVMEVLKQSEISQTQLQDAEHLQKKLFMTFDEVDEMSQRYSEDTEAGTEVAKNVATTAWSIGALTGTTALALAVAKGKVPIYKLVNGIANALFSKTSAVRTSINSATEIMSKDKGLSQLGKELFSKGSIQALYANEALKKPFDVIAKEIANIIDLKNLINGKQIAKFEDIIKIDELNKHLKQGKISVWTRKLFIDISKLWTKNKISKLPSEVKGMVPKELNQGLKFNYENYKTLINTSIVGGIPILGTIIGVPYAFNAWLTNIQKKAGKIGIMKAMEKIDTLEVFVDPSKNNDSAPVEKTTQTTSLLGKYKAI